MTIPDKLPIIRMEDYHTHYLGKTSDGRLFWAYETFAFTKPYSEIVGEDWQKFRNEYAILHHF
jgi:formate hydrogenlyase regulatory protein HycA